MTCTTSSGFDYFQQQYRQSAEAVQGNQVKKQSYWLIILLARGVYLRADYLRWGYDNDDTSRTTDLSINYENFYDDNAIV